MKSTTYWIAGACLVVAGVITFFALRPDPVDTAQLLRDARRAQRRMDLPAMKSATEAVLEVEPENGEARMMAAEVATREERLDDAIEHYAHVPESFEDYGVAQTARGDLLLFRNRAKDAETAFKAALATDPTLARANSKLAILLGAEGRRWESLPFLMQLVRSGQVSPTQQQPIPVELLYAGSLQRNLDVDVGEAFLKADSEYTVPLIGRARKLVTENQSTQAISILEDVIKAEPNQIEAHAQLGLLLIRNARKFLAWNNQVPKSADKHPQTWVARGLFLREQKQTDSAIRCFAEALSLDPDNGRANYQLGQLLYQAGEDQAAQPFRMRAKLLISLSDSLSLALNSPEKKTHVAMIASLTSKLGRVWEAAQWARLSAAFQQTPEAVQFAQAAKLRATAAQITASRTPVSLQPLAKLEWKKYPLPDWSVIKPVDSGGSPSEIEKECLVRFEDVTSKVGLDFEYFNSGNPDTTGRLMFEYTGGGIGIIDFDGDLWPDIYCSQGREWNVTDGTSNHHNCLFRNVGGERFEQVAELSGTDDRGFGQGVSVGDIDNDGFPDLYVANIGSNTLLHNNGDGTFSDISDQIADKRGRWTTSCLIADLDGDSYPDLYDVNYLTGDDIFDKMCPWGSDTFRACTPTAFAGEQDQAYRNAGNGSFSRNTEAWGLEVEDGKGLGIVAADFDENGKLDLFVANDAVANSCFLNSASGEMRFADFGIVRGLGFDDEGQPQGCMGVAAADANGDGRLDLFVTNFYEESNSLYLGGFDGFYADETKGSGLRQPGFLQLGFGTQFLDAELDGHPDLLVTNGHIDDFSFEGKPHEMPPHYYQNLGKGQFRQPDPAQIGPFFQRKYLGRAMARLDFNRDGREEIVVSHIDGETRILENTTQRVGNWIHLRVVGRNNRDGIGVAVSASTTRHVLTAGDGYQCSNERRLLVAVPGDPPTLSIDWFGSGPSTPLEDVSPNTHLIVIEGRGSFVLPH